MNTKTLLLAAPLLAAAATLPASAQEPFLDVGEQAPITILINSSPWFGGFEAVVDLYVEQTGNEVTLDVTPFNGMLEKARNAVRDSESPYDLVNLDTQWTIEFYEGGFLTPLTEIDPEFALPEQVLTYGDSVYWNAEKRWRTSDGGDLMAISPNGNIHLLYYRRDLFEEAGLAAPATWADVTAACEKLQAPPNLYGYVMRGERGNPIRFDWMPFMLGYGASIVKDPENGDYTVTINSPEAKQALDAYLDVAKRCGPPNIGSLGQGDLIQLLSTGTALQGHAVTAAWSSFEDPTKSTVVGKLQAAVLPHPEGRDPGVVI